MVDDKLFLGALAFAAQLRQARPGVGQSDAGAQVAQGDGLVRRESGPSVQSCESGRGVNRRRCRGRAIRRTEPMVLIPRPVERSECVDLLDAEEHAMAGGVVAEAGAVFGGGYGPALSVVSLVVDGDSGDGAEIAQHPLH